MSRPIVAIFGASALLCITGSLVLSYLGKPVPEGLIAGAVASPLAALAGALQQPKDGGSEEPKP